MLDQRGRDDPPPACRPVSGVCRVQYIARSGVVPVPRGQLGLEGRPPEGLPIGRLSTVVWLSFENSTVCRCLVCLSSLMLRPLWLWCRGVSLGAPGLCLPVGSGVFAGTVCSNVFCWRV